MSSNTISQGLSEIEKLKYENEITKLKKENKMLHSKIYFLDVTINLFTKKAAFIRQEMIDDSIRVLNETIRLTREADTINPQPLEQKE